MVSSARSAPLKLIVMGCSATKRRDRHPTAIDRYDGPMWRSLRARLSTNPSATLALRVGELEIMFLSAEYGFRDASMRISAYDRKMTSAHADELCGMWSSNCAGLARRFAEAEAVLFAGGSIYRRAMWKASEAGFSKPEKITETDGGGIGYQCAALSAWLATHYPPPDTPAQ
jgi:hypothetical protein